MSSQKWRNSCPVDMCNKVWFSHKSTKAIRVQCMQKGMPWSYLSVWKILVQVELFYKSSYRLHCDMVTHTAQLQVTCSTITAFARSHCISNVDHNSPERYKANTMEIQQGKTMNQSADLTSPAFLQAEASRHSPYLSNGSPSLAAWDIDIESVIMHHKSINRSFYEASIIFWLIPDYIVHGPQPQLWVFSKKFLAAGSQGNSAFWTRQHMTSEMLSFSVLAVTALSVGRINWTVC